MDKEVIVISLGGSLIIPDKINTKYLKEFKKIILKNSKKYKFLIICGGGKTARTYINGIKELGMNNKFQSFAGISATRMNARIINYLFNQDPKKGVAHKTRTLRRLIKKQDIVVCGALEYHPKETSDSTAANLARKFNSIFINLTNVKGLYDKNPNKFRDAKFISKISWKDFDKMANKLTFKPGQHFVLDQSASKIIMKDKITTYIVGKNLKQLDNILQKKKFVGTKIEG